MTIERAKEHRRKYEGAKKKGGGEQKGRSRGNEHFGTPLLLTQYTTSRMSHCLSCLAHPVFLAR